MDYKYAERHFQIYKISAFDPTNIKLFEGSLANKIWVDLSKFDKYLNT